MRATINYGTVGGAVLAALVLAFLALAVMAAWRERTLARESGDGASLDWADTLHNIRGLRNAAGSPAPGSARALHATVDTDVFDVADLRTRIRLDDIEETLSAGLTAVTERAHVALLTGKGPDDH